MENIYYLLVRKLNDNKLEYIGFSHDKKIVGKFIDTRNIKKIPLYHYVIPISEKNKHKYIEKYGVDEIINAYNCFMLESEVENLETEYWEILHHTTVGSLDEVIGFLKTFKNKNSKFVRKYLSSIKKAIENGDEDIFFDSIDLTKYIKKRLEDYDEYEIHHYSQ